MSATLRVAETEDCSSIAALMTDVICATVDEPYQTETINNSINNLEYWKAHRDSCVHLVAEINSSIVGVILVKEFWNLCSLFVDVRHHRNGIGRALTEVAISACKNRSPKEAVFLNSSPFAVNFYTVLGFQPRETTQQLHPGVKPMRFNFVPGKA